MIYLVVAVEIECGKDKKGRVAGDFHVENGLGKDIEIELLWQPEHVYILEGAHVSLFWR